MNTHSTTKLLLQILLLC